MLVSHDPIQGSMRGAAAAGVRLPREHSTTRSPTLTWACLRWRAACCSRLRCCTSCSACSQACWVSACTRIRRLRTVALDTSRRTGQQRSSCAPGTVQSTACTDDYSMPLQLLVQAAACTPAPPSSELFGSVADMRAVSPAVPGALGGLTRYATDHHSPWPGPRQHRTLRAPPRLLCASPRAAG